jgi:hypothetical protein
MTGMLLVTRPFKDNAMFRPIHRPTRRLSGFVLILVSCLVAAGCGGKRASVGGTVTYDGQPVDGGRIFFIPQGDPKGRPAVHATIEQGKYYLSASQGPEFGRHRVEIVWHKKPGGKPLGKPGDPGFSTDDLVQTLPAVYNAKSTLAVNVEPGSNTFDYALEKQPKPKHEGRP